MLVRPKAEVKNHQEENFCRQNWTAERINRMEAIIRNFRARLAQTRRLYPSQVLPRQESGASSSAELRSHPGSDGPGESCWPFSDDALSEAGSLELVEDLERRLDCLRDSLASSSHPSPSQQVFLCSMRLIPPKACAILAIK